MTYKVLIEETVSETFEIEADSIEESREKVIEGYKNCDIVLEPGNLLSAEFTICDEDENPLSEKESIF